MKIEEPFDFNAELKSVLNRKLRVETMKKRMSLKPISFQLF
jgi:hypothetical protein